jgi:hypothetical protein
MAVTALQLRGDLSALLRNYIGTYHLANGATTPAVMVLASNEQTASPTRPVGMELVIGRQPTAEQADGYREVGCQERWTLTLKDWNSPGVSAAAAELICAVYDTAATVRRAATPPRNGPLRQLEVTLLDPQPLDHGQIARPQQRCG